MHSKIVRIKALLGTKKSSIIIPESGHGWDWGDYSIKIKSFMGKGLNPLFYLADTNRKTLRETVQHVDNGNNYLSKCLIGSFNDSFGSSPNRKVIQQWFQQRWQVGAGLRVTTLDHNKFHFELPSTREAARIKNGKWYWQGKKLTVQWWSPKQGTYGPPLEGGLKWVKIFGIPLHARTTGMLKEIGTCAEVSSISMKTRGSKTTSFGLTYVYGAPPSHFNKGDINHGQLILRALNYRRNSIDKAEKGVFLAENNA